jgi:hypothetical protein
MTTLALIFLLTGLILLAGCDLRPARRPRPAGRRAAALEPAGREGRDGRPRRK